MQTQVFDRDGFESFREELLARRNKVDIVASTGAMSMDSDGSFHIETNAAPDYVVQPNTWAHSQIASFTDIPSKYYNRMRMQDPELLAVNVNTWLKRNDTPRLIRSFNKEMIAFLSDRYMRLDNYDVAEWSLKGALDASPTVQVFRSYITDKAMRITLWDPETAISLPSDPKDVYYPALSIVNSEVGAHSYNVRSMLIREVCSNGLLLGARGYSHIHMGKKLDEGDNSMWSAATLDLQAKLIISQANDVAHNAFNKENALFELAKLEHLKTEPMKATFLNVTGSILGLTDDENTSVWNRMERNNKYEFVQAVTNLATDYYNKDKDPERGTELEELGGRLLDGYYWNDIERETQRKKQSELR